MGEFGDKFRIAREKKELSLDDVSNVTKISARMLKAIEQEHFDQLPGGVFNKGFIRAYAKHLGLDAEEAVTDYLASLRQAQIDAHEVWEPQPPVPVSVPAPVAKAPKVQIAEPKTTLSKAPTPVDVEELPDLQLPRSDDIRPPRKDFTPKPVTQLSWRVIAALALVLILGIFLWSRRRQSTESATSQPRPATAQVDTTRPVTVPQPQSTNPNQAATVVPQQTPQKVDKPGSAPSTATQTATAPVPHAPTSQPVVAPATNAPTTEVKGDVTIRNFGKPLPKPSEKPSGSLTLVIRATENSWISVIADGQQGTEETLIAPANTSVHATREITVRTGNAAGVTFLFNGTEIPVQGGEAEVKTFVFDSAGLKSAQ